MPRLALLLGFCTAFTSTAYAGDSFEQLDRNQDGKLDQQELVVGGLFVRADANGDARLTAAEFHGPAHLHRDWDADGDMRLSEDEFHWALFRHADADNDLALSAEEYQLLVRLLVKPAET
jgi:hypothetical protein